MSADPACRVALVRRLAPASLLKQPHCLGDDGRLSRKNRLLERADRFCVELECECGSDWSWRHRRRARIKVRELAVQLRPAALRPGRVLHMRKVRAAAIDQPAILHRNCSRDTPQRLKPHGFLGQPAHWRA